MNDIVSSGNDNPSRDASADAPTVLVVDDEAANVTSLEKIFRRDGFRVLTASGAKAALELARNHRVEVVLTDLMMPGISGLELMRALKQLLPDVEVVMMTAYGTVEAAVQAMRDGAYDFVEKPLKRMTIVKTVRKAAERQSLVAENAYGFVVQGETPPNVGDGLQYNDNDQDNGPQGGLPVPKSAIDVPFLQENHE